MRHPRSQRGQVLVLVALLIAVLAAFLGLVIDGGGIAAEQQLVRNAADGAALTGGYAIFRQLDTEAAATTAAQKVLLANSLPTGDLTMAYLDAGGVATATPALVRTVRATVTDARSTTFLQLVGLASTQISATAQVAGGAGAAAPCALCALSSSLTGISLGGGSHLTITGASLIVNSLANPNVSVGPNAQLSAPSIVEAGTHEQNGGTITPPSPHGSAVADPHSTAPVPSVSGSAVAYTAPAGSSSINPGIYSSVTVNTGSSLTLNAGTYVLTGDLILTGGSLTGAGVTLYLACSGYPTSCSGSSGANFALSGGTVTLSPPASGTYAGMTVFADRNNSASSTFSRAGVNITGTWYSLVMPIVNTHNGDNLAFGEVDAAAVSISNNTVMTVSYVQAQSYGGASGTGPVSLSL